jgi:hypothetical protein
MLKYSELINLSSANAVKTVRGRAMPVLDFPAKAAEILLNLQRP